MRIRTCDQLIRYLEQIPEERWVGFKFRDEDGRCCVMGHLGATTLMEASTAELGKKVVKLFPYLGGGNHDEWWPYALVDANNGAPEGQIKESVLMLLKQTRTRRFLLRPIKV